MFQKLKLSTKIALLVAASLLGLLFAVIYSATCGGPGRLDSHRGGIS